MTYPLQTEEQRIVEALRIEQMRQEDEGLSRDYIATFGSPAGQKVWADIQREAFMSETTLVKRTEGGIDPYASAAQEGTRVLALYIKSRIEFFTKENRT